MYTNISNPVRSVNRFVLCVLRFMLKVEIVRGKAEDTGVVSCHVTPGVKGEKQALKEEEGSSLQSADSPL